MTTCGGDDRSQGVQEATVGGADGAQTVHDVAASGAGVVPQIWKYVRLP